MSDHEDDECDNGYDDAADCDCSNAEVDILTGESYCLYCRRTRVLNSEELTRELQLQAEAYETYAAEMEKCAREETIQRYLNRIEDDRKTIERQSAEIGKLQNALLAVRKEGLGNGQ